jgi:hypothetical protein
LVFLDWITGAFIMALSLYVSLYLCPFFRAGPGRSIDGPVGFQCYIAYQFTCDNSMLHFWKNGHSNGMQ